MSDPVTAAHVARHHLARGLGLLQLPGMPPTVFVVADSIATAMGALYRIECTRGAAAPDAAATALVEVRRALGLLQDRATVHPVVEETLDDVAASLSLVHALAQGVNAVAPTPPRHEPTRPRHEPTPPQAPERQAAPVPRQDPPPWASPEALRGEPEPPRRRPPAPDAIPARSPAVPAASPRGAGAESHPLPPQHTAGLPRILAELGVHSTSNFYKGLSGNDVIEAGGLFVATYQIPPIGQRVLLQVALPGGYEFEACGVVRWVRDIPQAGDGSPPGFGAELTQLTSGGRQLVQRYVRNREPLFHDDL